MNLQEVKHQFPEAVAEIEALENLGFASRSLDWIDTLDLEQAKTACWLVGRVGDDRDADALISILSGHRRELFIQAATSLSLIATGKHIQSLLSILVTSSDPTQRNSVVYALSFLANREREQDVISTLIEIVANKADTSVIRAQALEGIGNRLSTELPENLYQRAVDVMIQSLDDTEAEVRFWACFAAGATQTKEALPKLQVLAQTDRTILSGWWAVGEEAQDSITLINGGTPPLRQPYKPSMP
ncbi:HEAT repeat domain-containing protein [Alkalinema sp. FACHB-956]|uniref:HEAT repeat domain-containing protein n=1 Tax=Alkalinema sp. FACHB-956 TaxID=2692768 RepID=UPI0016846421|nr:HEAT repeat domain-containing protein [Alkalinema sp. FACHB-956]MBD2325780.1 HEAT repeat domain-containing protein [Alkalinema sp. FACHB-956]